MNYLLNNFEDAYKKALRWLQQFSLVFWSVRCDLS
jgi:hypothetical protein